MKSRSLCLSLVLFAASVLQAPAQQSAFTYQGRLAASGIPANGFYDLSFALFATNVGGVPIGAPITKTNLAIGDGLFQVTLDFGAESFDGAARWLEIGTRPSGQGRYYIMAPRQELTGMPYALRAATASSVSTSNLVASLFTGNGAGLTNLPASALTGQLPLRLFATNGVCPGLLRDDGSNVFFNMDGIRFTNLPVVVPRTVFLSPSGNDANAQRERADAPFGTAVAAFAALQSGDTLNIAPGVYPSTCAGRVDIPWPAWDVPEVSNLFTNGIRLQNLSNVVIEGNGAILDFSSSYGTGILFSNLHQVTFRNLEMKGCATGLDFNTNWFGLGISAAVASYGNRNVEGGLSDHIIFDQCYFHDWPDQALAHNPASTGHSVDFLTVQNCHFRNIGTTNWHDSADLIAYPPRTDGSCIGNMGGHDCLFIGNFTDGYIGTFLEVGWGYMGPPLVIRQQRVLNNHLTGIYRLFVTTSSMQNPVSDVEVRGNTFEVTDDPVWCGENDGFGRRLFFELEAMTNAIFAGNYVIWPTDFVSSWELGEFGSQYYDNVNVEVIDNTFNYNGTNDWSIVVGAGIGDLEVCNQRATVRGNTFLGKAPIMVCGGQNTTLINNQPDGLSLIRVVGHPDFWLPYGECTNLVYRDSTGTYKGGEANKLITLPTDLHAVGALPDSATFAGTLTAAGFKFATGPTWLDSNTSSSSVPFGGMWLVQADGTPVIGVGTGSDQGKAWFAGDGGGLTNVPVSAPGTVFLAPNGNDVTAMRGRQDRPFGTIGSALLAAKSGDLISFAPGTYTTACVAQPAPFEEFVALPPYLFSLTNVLVEGHGAVIQMSGSGNAIVFANCCDLKFRDLTFIGDTSAPVAGVHTAPLASCGPNQRVTIDQCRFLNCPDQAIGFTTGHAGQVDGLTVLRCYFNNIGSTPGYGAADSACVSGLSGGTCRIEGCRTEGFIRSFLALGLTEKASQAPAEISQIICRDNVCEGLWYAGCLIGSKSVAANDVRITGNVFSFAHGMNALSPAAVGLFGGTNVSVDHNTFKNRTSGIHGTVTVSQNQFPADMDTVLVEANTFLDCSTPVLVGAVCSSDHRTWNATVRGNSFVRSTGDTTVVAGAVNSSIENNRFDENPGNCIWAINGNTDNYPYTGLCTNLLVLRNHHSASTWTASAQFVMNYADTTNWGPVNLRFENNDTSSPMPNNYLTRPVHSGLDWSRCHVIHVGTDSPNGSFWASPGSMFYSDDGSVYIHAQGTGINGQGWTAWRTITAK